MIGAIEGDEAGVARWIAREIPLGRLQTAEDVASAIARSCSDDAAHVAGEALDVGGGQTMVSSMV